MPQSSAADCFRALSPTEQARRLASLSTDGQAELLYDWAFWARPEQLPPDGAWKTWLILAGRGWGKSRTGAEFVRAMICGETPLSAGRYNRVAIVGETSADARDVMVEGESGLLSVHPADFRPLYEPSKRRLTWPNGAVGTLYNATEPDQLRGPQADLAWADEPAKWQYAQETWDQLQFGLRLGHHPRQVATTTPRPIPMIKRLIADPTTVTTRGRTMDNRANLAASFIEAIHERYAGTRLGRQELEAEILDDVPGALWTREMIERTRIDEAPQLSRVVVAIDPSGTSGSDEGDDIGIVVVGRGMDGRGYVLEDPTCKLSPDAWARVAVTAYHRHQADRIVAERNFGGAMVEAVIRNVDRSVAYKEVTASRGKAARAEPVSALYEQGRVSHLRRAGLEALEDEMMVMTPNGYLGEGSPNRVDALVWAMTEAMLSHQPFARAETPVSIPSLKSAFSARGR
jgi:phage terminase large subunit-like protein